MIYIWRSLKFLLSIVVLYVAALWILRRAGVGSSLLTWGDTMRILLLSWRGRVLIAAVAVWSALYPLVGFVKRSVAGSLSSDRERIERACIRSGYVLVREESGVLTFRSSSLLQRVRCLFEDKVTVRECGETMVIEGIRRAVVAIESRYGSR